MRRVLCSFPSAAASENGTSFEVASCFRWRGNKLAASVLSNRTGKPLPCHKLSAIHVHRRIVASTSCGKYLSRLFIALPFNHSCLYPAKSLVKGFRNKQALGLLLGFVAPIYYYSVVSAFVAVAVSSVSGVGIFVSVST